MRVSNLGLAYSIRKAIEKDLGIDAIVMFDGIVLPKTKPYVVIVEFPTTNEQLAKGRETIVMESRFRIEVSAETSFQLSEYSEKVDELFMFSTEIKYYTSSGTLTNFTFEINPGYMKSPEFSDDKSKDIDKHRVFFDIEINTSKHKNIRGIQ